MTDPDVHTPASPPPSPTPVASGPGDTRGHGRRGLTVALVVLLVASLAAGGLLGVSRRDERRRANRLADRLASVEKELADLRGRVGGDGDSGEGEAPNPDDLLGGDLGELLDDLLGENGDLGDLLGENGLGDLGGLLGENEMALLECMGGAGGLGSLLGGGGPGETPGDDGGSESVEIPDDDLNAQYKAVAKWVAQERGLEYEAVPSARLVDSDEMKRLVRDEIRREYPAESARLDSDLLAALGAVTPGTDMREVQTDLVSGQVAGFYDPRNGEMVVLADDPREPLSGYALVALAHEMEHALADQQLDLPIDVDEMTGASDEQMAATALIEGDASLLMYRFSSEALSLAEQMAMGLDPSALAAQASLADTPAYLVSQLQFPYLDGLMFACGLESDGGWDAVDGAYADPPTTTAQILFPERYASGEGAVDPPDPSSPGGSWKMERARTFGAADLVWLFQAPGDDTAAALDDPNGRAAGWAGGEAVQWTDGDRAAIGMSFMQHDGEADLCASITDWYRAAFADASDRDIDGGLAFEGGGQTAVLHCDGSNIRLGIAPDLDTAKQIAS